MRMSSSYTRDGRHEASAGRAPRCSPAAVTADDGSRLSRAGLSGGRDPTNLQVPPDAQVTLLEK